MPTFTRINFDKIFGTVAPDPANPTLQTSHGIASWIFYDMLNNGFRVVYPTGSFDMYNCTEIVFEAKGPIRDATHNVDPLGDTQPWRIGFKVKGYNANPGGGGNELWCYVGTNATMGSGVSPEPLGIDEFNSVAMLLVQ